LNSSFHDLAVSLIPGDSLDLARRALAAAAWLVKHVPQIAILSPPFKRVNYYIYGTPHTMMQFSSIPGIDLTDEVYKVLDELFSTMEASLYADGGLFWQQELLSRGIRWSARRPLVRFWTEICKLPNIDRYLLPRVERLERSGFAAEPLGCLIHSITNNAPDVPPLVSYKALDALLRLSGSGTHHAFALGTAKLGENSKVMWQYYIISFMSHDLVNEDESANEHRI
jgi:hypothetical protein